MSASAPPGAEALPATRPQVAQDIQPAIVTGVAPFHDLVDGPQTALAVTATLVDLADADAR